MTSLTDIVAAGHSVSSHPVPDGCSQIFAPCLDPHCQRPCGAHKEDAMTHYSCPVCRTQDDSAYMWCQDPGCPDGHDQVKSELQRQAAIGVRHMRRSEASNEALSIIADRNGRRMAYFIAMVLTTIMGLALICGMAAWSMPRVERATQEDMQ